MRKGLTKEAFSFFSLFSETSRFSHSLVTIDRTRLIGSQTLLQETLYPSRGYIIPHGRDRLREKDRGKQAFGDTKTTNGNDVKIGKVSVKG